VFVCECMCVCCVWDSLEWVCGSECVCVCLCVSVCVCIVCGTVWSGFVEVSVCVGQFGVGLWE